MAKAEELPCSPSSDFVQNSSGTSLGFCADWNPEFAYRGYLCCPRTPRFANGKACEPSRRKSTYCGDMTEDQKMYTEAAMTGRLGDVLQVIDSDRARARAQAYCTVNTGFLAWGRPLVPSDRNWIQLRTNRCLNFGTDPMVGMLEWLGRQVKTYFREPQYQQTRLLVGDMAAPKGGCLTGRRGRRGHASHTSGQDADIGFLTPLKNQPSPPHFHKKLDAKVNWWFLKELFHNPYACVKVIFLDRRQKAKLAKAAGADPEWARLSRFIQHEKSHKNHFHVRIGDGPGQPGCKPGANPELEEPDEEDIKNVRQEANTVKVSAADSSKEE
jgi:murein endopeptidase